MFEKYKTLNMFNKGMVFTIMYSIIALILGLVLLCLDTSWIYGVLIGILLIIVTSIISFFLYKIPCKGAMNAVGIPIISLIIRIIVFITIYCIVVFTQNELFQPINSLMMLFTYMIPMYAYFTVAFIGLFGKKSYK